MNYLHFSLTDFQEGVGMSSGSPLEAPRYYRETRLARVLRTLYENPTVRGVWSGISLVPYAVVLLYLLLGYELVLLRWPVILAFVVAGIAYMAARRYARRFRYAVEHGYLAERPSSRVCRRPSILSTSDPDRVRLDWIRRINEMRARPGADDAEYGVVKLQPIE